MCYNPIDFDISWYQLICWCVLFCLFPERQFNRTLPYGWTKWGSAKSRVPVKAPSTCKLGLVFGMEWHLAILAVFCGRPCKQNEAPQGPQKFYAVCAILFVGKTLEIQGWIRQYTRQEKGRPLAEAAFLASVKLAGFHLIFLGFAPHE